MTKYSFHINPNEPGEDRINRQKDFGRVMQNYQRMTHPLYRTPLYRYRKVFLSLLLVLLCVWLVMEFGDEEATQKNKNADSLKNDSVKTEGLP
ncbi:MAG: hypothetical protein MUC87_09835 [Bacteroidia bacterium]|jgi:hypothetical protein|nr:hypothetical protein [Bacteroidia bacterium]